MSDGGSRGLARLAGGILLAISALASTPGPAACAEIDSLTDRARGLADASEQLEGRLNDALRTGVARANQTSEGCNEETLYRELRRALVTPFIGHVLTESLNEDGMLDRRRIRREESIYRDLDVLDAISVHWKDLSAVVRVGETLTGVDKIGHFIVEGWQYFEIAYREGDGIAAAMAWGKRTERTYFGLYTTGVFSYADLVADFEGMRFWLRVLGGADDPLDRGWRAKRPYVTCGRRFWIAGDRRWRLARELDLDRYVTPVWDEAVNCCRYRNEEIEGLVRARIAELSEAAAVDYTCPVDSAACARARERYGVWAPELLHPDCLGAPAPERPWWHFWKGAGSGATSRIAGLLAETSAGATAPGLGPPAERRTPRSTR